MAKTKPKEKSSIASFSPSIIINNKTYCPKGYEWILGFALGGCQWAINKASTEEFKAMVIKDLKKETDKKVINLINIYTNKIIKLKEELYNEA